MARLTYAQLNTALPDNTTGAILPINVRDIVDSYSGLRILAIHPAVPPEAISVLATPTPITLTVSGTPTAGMSVVSNAIVFGNTGRYTVIYKLNVESISNARDITVALYSGTTLLDYSQVTFTIATGKTSTFSGGFSINITNIATQDINMKVYADSAGASAVLKGFVSVLSQPVSSP